MTPRWLRDAARLAADHGRARTTTSLERLAAGLERSTWRITVVGEPGAGKSTLIHRVAGREGLAGAEVVEADWDPTGPPLEAVTDTDGLLVVVPATAAWGAAQSRLLEDAVSAHVSSVAVVVTMLDRVGVTERGHVLTYIGARMGAVVLLSGPGSAPDDASRVAIRSFLTDTAPVNRRAELRARRIAARLADQCTAMATSATETIADARRVHSGQLLDPRSARERDWELVRVRLSARQLALIGRVGDTLRADRTAVLARLRGNLAKVADPVDWLVSALRGELAAQAERTERLILTGIAADADWVDAEIRRHLPDARPWRPPDTLGLRVEPSDDGSVLGHVVAQGAGAAVHVPIPLPSPQDLASAVESATGTVVNQTWAVLASAYEPLFADLAVKQQAWQEEQSTAPTTTTDWYTLARAATALAGAIHGTLRNLP
ncbi:hypothetical protein [Actinokineospora sp. NBRC 105648]|uniref:hypothetical protein n=1 Tax=Actinokineospora sp. NBRC 105648 TaxID=3032206 RepID=UPI0024A0BB4D|nr:hypothetical protein [Actinokineospora sp. NBRC 105648]GLZ39057.1 hypothetical protein Acsp05_26810 [Actinokineospora sp. NBRC 105648]